MVNPMEQQLRQLTPHTDDCQAVVFFHGRKVLTLPASPVIITVPATPQSGIATANIATSVGNNSPTFPDTAPKPSNVQKGANLTSTGLAALTNSTRGDKLRDTRVWVAGLTMSPQPPGPPPATATSTSESTTFAGTCTTGNYFQNQRPMTKQTIPYRRSDDNRLFKHHMSSTVGTAAGVGGASGGMEPSGCRRGSHFSNGNDGSAVDTGSSSIGAVTSPVGAPPTRASSATTTSSLGALDATVCSTSGPWADFVVATATLGSTTVNIATTAGTAAAAAVTGIAAASSGHGTAAAAAAATVIPGAAAGSGASWTSGDNDEENAPLLSAYVAAMPSAGVAPPNEDIRIASKRQRSTSDSVWSASRQHPHPHPHGAQLPAGSVAAMASAAAAASAAVAAASPPPPETPGSGGGSSAATAAATASSPTLTLPCALLPRRITQQQQQQHVNPYPTHHHQHPHHLQHSHQHVLLHGQGRRQSLESYRLPLVTAGPVAVTGASATPTATTATNSPALSDRGNPSCRVVPTPSLVRDIPRAMFEVSDISDKSSDTSDEDPEECGISLRLPPLQPCPSHLKLIRSSVDGDLGPRPRQPGHSFFTDSQDEFDGWQQQQQQQQPQQQQQQPSHCHSPHGIGRFLPAAFRNQQPPFLQCRSGPAMGAGGAGGGGGGGGGNGDGDVAAGSVSQLRSSSCTSVSSRTLPAAAVAAALGTTLSGEGHGGGLSSASPLRPSGCGGILQPYARDEHLLPVAKPILSPMQVDAAALGSASGCASAAGFSATAVPAGGGGGGGGGCAATLTSSLSPVGSVTAAAPSPPPPSAVKPQTAWPAITPTMMQTPTSPSLPVLTSPRCPAVSGVATTAAAASAAVALTSSVQAVDSVQALVRSHPFPPSPAAAFITAAASPEPTVTAPSQPQPTAPSNLHAVQLQPQLQPQDQTAPRDGYAPAEIACLSIGSPDGAAAAAAVPVIRRRQPVPPPMPPASRSRRGLLSSVTEESIAAAGAAAAAATTAVIAITAAATSENL